MTKRWLSDSRSRASKKAAAIHAQLKAEVYREIEAEADTDKQSRKRQASLQIRQQGGP